MNDAEKQLKKVEKLFEMITEEYVKPDEVEAIFTALTALIEKTKEELLQNMAQNKGEMTEEMETKHQEILETHTKLEAIMSKMGAKMTKECKEVMSQCMEKIKEVEEMIPTPTDLSEIEQKIANVESKIPKIPDIPDIKPLEENIEVIQNDIDEIKKDVEELKKRPIGGRGGGTSALAVAHAFKYIFKAETPSGTINGSNVTFTVQNNIWAIISIELNGEVYPSTGYDFVNHTITFDVAPPAVFSGKDFICKYIAS